MAETDHVLEWGGYAVDSIKKAFRGLVKRAELANPKEVVPYTLRHTAATWLAQDGVSLWEIAGLLGHATTTMVERHYAHHHPDYRERSRQALNDRLVGLKVDPTKLTPRSAGRTKRKAVMAAAATVSPHFHPTPPRTDIDPSAESRGKHGGRDWDRTSDPYDVNVVLSR